MACTATSGFRPTNNALKIFPALIAKQGLKIAGVPAFVALPVVVPSNFKLVNQCVNAIDLASGFYHGLRFDTDAERLFWLRMDRSAIFLLILGSQLPIFAAFLDGRRRAFSIGIASTITIVGMIYQWQGMVSQEFAIASYVGMGAVGALTVPWWAKKVGWDGMKWFVTATSLYVAGAVVEAMQWPIPIPGIVGHHELLHLFDTAATLVHFGFVVRFVVIPVTTATESYDSPVETTSSEPALCLPAATTSAIT